MTKTIVTALMAAGLMLAGCGESGTEAEPAPAAETAQPAATAEPAAQDPATEQAPATDEAAQPQGETAPPPASN